VHLRYRGPSSLERRPGLLPICWMGPVPDVPLSYILPPRPGNDILIRCTKLNVLMLQDEAAVEAAEARLAGRDPDAAATAGADGAKSTSGSDSDEDGSVGDAKEHGAAHESLPEGSGGQPPSAQAGSMGAELRQDLKADPSGEPRRLGSKTPKRRKIQEL